MTTRFSADSSAGLTEVDAARRLAEEGPNELPSAKPRSILAIAFSVVSESISLLLTRCTTVMPQTMRGLWPLPR
jgi:Ca2+-transporting ATPase